MEISAPESADIAIQHGGAGAVLKILKPRGAQEVKCVAAS